MALRGAWSRLILRFESKNRVGCGASGFYLPRTNKIDGGVMREIIRIAKGKSVVGDFTIAMSDKGMVALEFDMAEHEMRKALEAKVPQADVVLEQAELQETVACVARAIEAPGLDPGIPLDLRGTPYEVQVWGMLREIMPGETTTYGALASKLGTRDARDVTKAIAGNAVAVLVPCHRVIKADGSISGYKWGVRRKRALLEREQRPEAWTLG